MPPSVSNDGAIDPRLRRSGEGDIESADSSLQERRMTVLNPGTEGPQLTWPFELRCRSVVAKQIPQSHQGLQLRLHTTGAYAVQAGYAARLPHLFRLGDYNATQHRLFNHVEHGLTWIPWVSGPSGRYLQLLIIVITAGCYVVLLSRTSSNEDSVLLTVGPPLLAIVSARFMLFIARQELRRIDNQPPNVTSSSSLRRYVKTQIALIVLIFAPLLSIPVRPTARYTFQKEPNLQRMPQCFSFDSLADYVQSQIPTNIDDANRQAVQATTVYEIDPWIKSIDPTWLLPSTHMEPVLSNTLNLSPGLPVEKSWIWGRAVATHALYAPFYPRKVYPKHTIDIDWRHGWPPRYLNTRMLTGGVKCNQLNASLILHTDPLTNNQVLRTDVVDYDGCTASLSLSVVTVSTEQIQRLRGTIEHYVETLSSTSVTPEAAPYFEAKLGFFRSRLHEYITRLNSSERIVSIRPQFVPSWPQDTEIELSLCKHKFFLAVPMDPVRLVSDPLERMSVAVASCITEYTSIHFGMSYQTGFLDVPFLQHSSQGREIEFSSIERIHLMKSSRHELKLSRAINELLPQQLSNLAISDTWSPSQLIEYEFLMISRIEKDSIHAIAYAADKLMSAVFDKLSVAANMIPPKCQSYLEDPIIAELSYSHLQEVTLQKQHWFQYLLWSTICGLIFVTTALNILADDSPSGLPWSISSIAARAALLCRSRLPHRFSKNFYTPDSILDASPLRIGRWSHSEEGYPYLWRVDSLLNEFKIKIPKALPTWSRHSFQSLPDHAQPIVVFHLLSLIGIAVLVSHSAARQLGKPDDTITTSPLTPIILGTGWRHEIGFWNDLYLNLMPAILSVTLTSYWWDSLTTFYKTRLPWAELLSPNIASRTLTLDYSSLTFPVIKALRMRHWMLAVLIIGSIVVTPLPIFAARLFDLKWVLKEGKILMGARNLTWQGHLLSSETSTGMRQVLQDSLLAQFNNSALPAWSSYRTALIPADFTSVHNGGLKNQLPSGHVGYWELESSSIRAELQCVTLEHEYVSPSNATWLRQQNSIPFLDAQIGKDYQMSDGSKNYIVSPCFDQQVPKVDQSEVFCSHWELLSLRFGELSELVPVWLISTAHLSKDSVSAHVLLCQPKIFAGHGRTRLLSTSGDLQDAFVYSHTTDDEVLQDNEMTLGYSRILNRTITTPDPHDSQRHTSDQESGLRFTSPAVSLPGFRGDILSFMMYRDLFRNRRNMNDNGTIAEVSSDLFSTIFTFAAQNTNIFRSPTKTEQVPITTLIWQEVFVNDMTVNYIVAVIVCFLVIVMTTHIILMFTRKEYLFPIAPEPIQNTWFFLYRSGIVNLMEEKITGAQHLSLQEFYERVQGLGSKYVFRREPGDNTWLSATVDIAHSSSTARASVSDESGVQDEREDGIEMPLLSAEGRVVWTETT